MYPSSYLAVAILLGFTAISASEKRLELRGSIEPQHKAAVSISGVNTPMFDTTVSDSRGRFRFRDLPPDAYTVTVMVPGHGEVRRTVEVSPSFSDSRGRVEVTVPFEPHTDSVSAALERQNTVSVTALAIPDRAMREYEKANERLRELDTKGAIEHLERATEWAPQFAAAWNVLGVTAYKDRRYEDAEKYFREALDQEPGAFSPLVNLGGVLIPLGRYREALQYNLFAVREQPGDALANSQLGKTYFFLGNDEAALKYLKTAKRLDPSHFSSPQILLAQIYLRRSEIPNAIRELEDYLSRHPDAALASRLRELLEQIKNK